MKFTDRVAHVLLESGISRAYGVQGGSVSHLFDSFVSLGGKAKFSHHEQHAIFAASGDALVTRRPALVFVSTGPAGTNALTGLLGAWQDGIPLIVISGQTRSEEMSYGQLVRQIGSQEAPILDICRPITKESLLFDSPDDPEAKIQASVFAATTNRQGPVWIDIPIDVQLSEVFQ